MGKREELALKYNRQYKDLHDEFFETIYKGTPKQERVLKATKSANALNTRYAEITQNYETELATEGFNGLQPIIEPPRDLAAEIDDLKIRLKRLEL